MSYSRRLIRPLLDRDIWGNFGAIDECGHDADLLGQAFACAASAGGPVEVQRFDLFTYDRGLLRGRGPRRHSQSDLKGILLRIERPAM